MSKAVSALVTRRGSRPRRDRLAFTLIEVLVATGLTLLLMAAVAGIFALVTSSIADARSAIEMNDRVRAAQNTLQRDLKGMTGRGMPPLNPQNSPGYREIIEGPIGPCGPADAVRVVLGAPNNLSNDVGKVLLTSAEIDDAVLNKGETVTADTTVGDIDDILIFTTRSSDVPFTGRGGPSPASTPSNPIIIEAQSNVAEVAWFLRGRTLYRRVLLVDPTFDASVFTNNGAWNFPGRSYYDLCDISVRQVGGDYDPTTKEAPRLVANSLADLAKRENRFGHPPMLAQASSGPLGGGTLTTNWPHDARFWGVLRLPTLRESSDPNWPLPFYAPHNAAIKPAAGVVLPNGVPVHTNNSTFTQYPTVYIPVAERLRYDAWTDARQWDGLDVSTGSIIDKSVLPAAGDAQTPLMYPGKRFADDVILTNVVGFDVKVWDPGAPIFKSEMRLGVQDGGPTQTVTVAPGDPGFADAMKRLITNDQNTWPIAYGAFVDLGWSVDPRETTGASYYPKANWPPSPLPPGYKNPQFYHTGNVASALWGVPSDQTGTNPPPDFRARVYDTGSSHYERDGVDQGVVNGSLRGNVPDTLPDTAADGIDNNAANGPGIDDASEREAPPPYDAELQAIQVKIRVFEPDSRQIREVTVVQELVSQ